MSSLCDRFYEKTSKIHDHGHSCSMPPFGSVSAGSVQPYRNDRRVRFLKFSFIKSLWQWDASLDTKIDRTCILKRDTKLFRDRWKHILLCLRFLSWSSRTRSTINLSVARVTLTPDFWFLENSLSRTRNELQNEHGIYEANCCAWKSTATSQTSSRDQQKSRHTDKWMKTVTTVPESSLENAIHVHKMERSFLPFWALCPIKNMARGGEIFLTKLWL